MTEPVATSPATAAPAAAPAAPAAASAAGATAQAPAQAAVPATTQSTTAAPPAQPGNAQAAATATAAAPLKLALPEGSPLSEAHLAKISEMAQKQGWSQEVAQEVLARQSDAIKEHLGSLESEHKANIEAWNKELTADKEIGGQALSANLDAGRRALDQFGTPELVEALRASGYSAFPPLVKMLVKIGKAMGEDRVANGGQAVQNDLRSLYKSMPNP